MMTAWSFFLMAICTFQTSLFANEKIKVLWLKKWLYTYCSRMSWKEKLLSRWIKLMFFTFLSLYFEFEFHGSIFRTLTPGQKNKWWSKPKFNISVNLQTMIELNDLKEDKFYLEVWNRKVTFCMFLIIFFCYFHFFKKNPWSSFSPFIFFYSHSYLLNLFRLRFFWIFRNLQSLVHINQVWNAQNCFFFHFYCKQFLGTCSNFTPFTKSTVP